MDDIARYRFSKVPPTSSGCVNDVVMDDIARPAATSDSATSPSFQPFLRVAVVFITCGRPETLSQVMRMLESQTLRPAEVIVSACVKEDIAGVVPNDDVKIVYGPKGACRQRNTALKMVSSSIDIVVFFDDDFIAHARWIEGAARSFMDNPHIDCLTGYLLADGICKGGITFEVGADLIDRYKGEFADFRRLGYSPYGCNMAFRRTALAGLAFDERLVLYGWLEDRDFGAAVARRGGTQIKTGASVGVHLGATRGRMSGARLGYSQVVNPIYLFRKGNMKARCVADHLFRNIAMNVVRSFWAESHIDRRGRLMGNVRGLVDIFCGVLEPERAESLS